VNDAAIVDDEKYNPEGVYRLWQKFLPVTGYRCCSSFCGDSTFEETLHSKEGKSSAPAFGVV
jgi:hypothetical protein